MTIIGIQNHGFSKTRFYRIWTGMISRCNNKNRNIYKHYGGRGIEISKEWLDFIHFKNDMYQSYLEHVELQGESNTTIDRINNNGNYELSNCKWSTRKEQMQNRRPWKLGIKRKSNKNPRSEKTIRISKRYKTYVCKQLIDGKERFVVRDTITNEVKNII